jgi:hypothetical protein
MLCPKCNSEVADNNSVCPKCGHELPVSPSTIITSAVPHITSFSITNPPKTSAPLSHPEPVREHPPVVKKHSYLWLIFALIFLALAAVAVYSFNLFPLAMNPLEQSRQAKDAVVKNNITALLSSLDTYHTANFQYPWASSPTDGYSSLDIASESWITALSASPSSQIILIQGPGDSQPVHLCYLPQARANKNLTQDKCFSDHFYQQFSASICVKNREYLCFP